jgi:sugar lactone lactonase YvrE
MDGLLSRSTALALLTALLIAPLAGCPGDGGEGGGSGTTDSADRRDSAAATRDSAPAGRVASVTGDFKTPESVRYDAPMDLYFVTNINGNPSQKDNNGFIATVTPDSTGMTVLIQGGRDGITLNAPKGLAIAGDTLWVADIDVLRAFNKRTGAAIRSVDLSSRGAVFLNDVAIGSDGAIYITDTAIRFNADGSMGRPGTSRVYRVAPNDAVSVALEGASLGSPNGITWDGANGRFIIVPFQATAIMSWRPGDAAPTRLASGPGQYDGVEITGDGRILVSSWADSSIHVVTDSTMSKLIAGVSAPADIGYDTRRNRVLVPLFNGNTIEVFTVGTGR